MRPNYVSGYKVNSISIIKSDFYRIEKFPKGEIINHDADITVGNEVTKTIARCKLSVNCICRDDKKNEVAKADITVFGEFKLLDKDTDLEIQQFADLNAYAIMYPFIREHLFNLSLKAGMNAIMLPSVNFQEFAKQ